MPPSIGGSDSMEAWAFPKRLKALENENTKLKKLLAEQMLINDALKEIVEKKW